MRIFRFGITSHKTQNAKIFMPKRNSFEIRCMYLPFHGNEYTHGLLCRHYSKKETPIDRVKMDKQDINVNPETEEKFNYAKYVKNSSSFDHWTFMSVFSERFIRYSIIVGTVIGATYIFYSISSWFSSISLYDVASWSYTAGVINGVMGCGLMLLARRCFSLRPNQVYKAALARILKDADIRNQIGMPCQASKFRAYSYVYSDGTLYEDAPTLKKVLFWNRPRLQMIFRLGGTISEATVSCEVSKKMGFGSILANEFQFHSLTIDLDAQHGKKIIMKGTEEESVYQGVVKLR